MRTSSASRAQPANTAANYGAYGNADAMGEALNMEFHKTVLRLRYAKLRRSDVPELRAHYQDWMDDEMRTLRILARIRRAGRLGR